VNIELNYNATVNDAGNLIIANRKNFDQEVKIFKGKAVEVIVKRKKSQRSHPQNRYFHGVALPIIRARLIDLGFEEAYSKEWVKDFVKVSCLKVEIANPTTGEAMETLGKTSQLTKSEFADLVERLERWCAEKLDLILPMPGEVLTMDFN
jgi:hypothetical protein